MNPSCCVHVEMCKNIAMYVHAVYSTVKSASETQEHKIAKLKRMRRLSCALATADKEKHSKHSSKEN